METKAITRARKMPLDTLVNKLNEGGFTAMERPIIESIIAEKSAQSSDSKTVVQKPMSKLQQLIAKAHITGEIVAKTQAPKVEEPVKKSEKHKPNETTHSIEAFSDDTKGIRLGDTVSFPVTRKAGSLIMEGVVQRLFAFYDKYRDKAGSKVLQEEVKIKGTDGKRYYRFEEEIHLVSSGKPAAPVEE